MTTRVVKHCRICGSVINQLKFERYLGGGYFTRWVRIDADGHRRVGCLAGRGYCEPVPVLAVAS